MDITCLSQGTCEMRKSLSPEKNSKKEKDGHAYEVTQTGRPAEVMVSEPDYVDYGHLTPSLDHAGDFVSEDGRDNLPQTVSNNSCWSGKRDKKVSSKYGCKKYVLRSSLDCARVLRSRSNGICNSPPNTNTNSAHLSSDRRERRQKRKEINTALKDEFSRIRKRFRYLLNRMTYEQSLIDAYSGEGWKGQSLEKIRPEKELQRATSEILRCRLEIRDLFQCLDKLCANGKLQESLFDSDGQIYSEDIFCSKCGSKELTPDNDIILCDGVCDRGFHQMCLEPPLLNEEIPPGDETWLCPGCDCKVDCIDLLNDYQGTKLSIADKWQKVFPEAAATAGDRPSDNSSDNSDDNGYDPSDQELDDKALKDSSHAEESNSTPSSDDSKSSTSDEMHGHSGFSLDDSEDNDYDPDTQDNVGKEGSSSDESDFTSDSEDLGALINEIDPSALDEIPASSSIGHFEALTASGEGTSKLDVTENTVNSELLSILEPNDVLVSGKRQRERLDYKKLHDETYGNIPSDSSDDDDWTLCAPKKGKTDGFDEGIEISTVRNMRTIQNESKSRIQGKPQADDGSQNLNLYHYQPKLEVGGADHSLARFYSSGNKTVKSGPRSFGKEVYQRLYESLRMNIYPSRKTKENLSKELGITVQQVKKWFENSRRSLRLSANKEGSKLENYAANLGASLTISEKIVLSKQELVAKGTVSIGVMGSQLIKEDIFAPERNNREGEATGHSTAERYQSNSTGNVIAKSQLNKAENVSVFECDYRGVARKRVTEESYQPNISGKGGDDCQLSKVDIVDVVVTECENRDGAARKQSIQGSS